MAWASIISKGGRPKNNQTWKEPYLQQSADDLTTVGSTGWLAEWLTCYRPTPRWSLDMQQIGVGAVWNHFGNRIENICPSETYACLHCSRSSSRYEPKRNKHTRAPKTGTPVFTAVLLIIDPKLGGTFRATLVVYALERRLHRSLW